MAQTQECMLLSSSLFIPAQSAYILAAVTFTFGFYTLLFSLAVHLLLKAPVVMNRQMHLFWLISLFLLSSTGAALRIAALISKSRLERLLASLCIDNTNYDDPMRDIYGLEIAYHILFVVLNCLSDSIMIYRLFAIWGRKHQITILLIMVALLVFLLGIAATILTGVSEVNPYAAGSFKWELWYRANTMGQVYDSVNAVFNFLLTLTLGRIWWINHKAFLILSPAVRQKYRAVIIILLESGILYPLALVAHISAMAYVYDHYPGFLIDIAPLSYQMAGIAPTLIILRSMLRKSTESVTQVISTLQVEVGDNSELEISVSDVPRRQDTILNA